MARNNIYFEAQECYKGQYDKKATPVKVNIGDRVLVKKKIRRKGSFKLFIRESLSCHGIRE